MAHAKVDYNRGYRNWHCSKGVAYPRPKNPHLCRVQFIDIHVEICVLDCYYKSEDEDQDEYENAGKLALDLRAALLPNEEQKNWTDEGDCVSYVGCYFSTAVADHNVAEGVGQQLGETYYCSWNVEAHLKFIDDEGWDVELEGHGKVDDGCYYCYFPEGFELEKIDNSKFMVFTAFFL